MRAITRRLVRDGVETTSEINVQWRRYVGPWGLMMQFSGEGLDDLAARLADHSLGMRAVRVLLACVRAADRQNEVRAGSKDIARILAMDPSAVKKALKELVACGFLEPPKLRYSPYTISPRFCWKSNTGDLKRALAERGMLDHKGMMRSASAAA